MALKKLILNLKDSIEKCDKKMIEANLLPICSINALARELESQWPYVYDHPYTRNLLHRANKNGVKYPPPRLVQDLLNILMVSEKDLVKLNTLNKEYSMKASATETLKLKLKGNDITLFKAAVNKIAHDNNTIGFRKESLSTSEKELFRNILNHIDSPKNTSPNKKGTVRDLSK